uniref:Uncharacterized protein n=1 Tax=Myotis myotis TaxID=51298 RepID=A0A7J7T5Q8_MYOMY|nr:hypothetical protein mMyoMyo1_009168 [Myotis myotis]
MEATVRPLPQPQSRPPLPFSSQLVNWLRPPWGLRVSHLGLAAADSPRPSLKPEAAGHRPHYEAGESLQDRKAGTPSERLRDLDVLRRLDPCLPDYLCSTSCPSPEPGHEKTCPIKAEGHWNRGQKP